MSVAGLVAEQTGPGSAMAVIAAISVTVTPLLAPGLRSGARTTPVPSTAPGIWPDRGADFLVRHGRRILIRQRKVAP